MSEVAFIAASAVVATTYAWPIARDRICAARGHRLGAPCLRAAFEDGLIETERTCRCKGALLVETTRAFVERKGEAWVAPASDTTPGTSPSP